MSGLEIIGVVAGIVSAITAVGGAIKKARRERQAKLQAATQNLETRLITTLDNGPPRINGEYDNDVGRLGLRFLVVMVRNPSEQLLSDAIKETANSQLVSILMNVTGSLVNVVNSFIAAGQFTFSASNYQNWNSVGSKATDDTIRSLAQLYQRKLQAAPLPLNLLDSKFEDVEDVHWTYPGGEYYKGEAVNNKRHGYGKQHWADGRHYEGNWARNKQEGYGK